MPTIKTNTNFTSSIYAAIPSNAYDAISGNHKEDLWNIANLAKEFGISVDVRYHDYAYEQMIEPTVSLGHVSTDKAYAMLACTKILGRLSKYPDLQKQFNEIYLMLQMSDNSIPRNPFA